MKLNWKIDIAPHARESLLRRSVLIANVILICLLAYSAATITWMLWPDLKQIDAPPTTTSASINNVKAIDALTLSRDITSRHLFGEAAAVVPVAQPAVIPETRLNLVLRGVMAHDDPKNATAIIAEPSGKEAFYPVGREVPGGATLKEVHQQHIVLTRNGRDEILKLPKETLLTNFGGASLPPPAQVAPPSQILPPPAAPINPAPGSGALLKGYRDAFFKNPNSLAELLNGAPVRNGNQIIGFQLHPGKDPTIMTQLGLMPGDVVTSINGMSLTDPASRTNLLRILEGARQLNVTVLRNNVQQTFEYRMD